MSNFLNASWFKREEFWKHPRRGSIVWSSGARFPFGPAATFWGVLHLLSACAGCKPAERGCGYRCETAESCCVSDDDDDSKNTLTWQALRLSLISTWLVWEPTHMYTWRKERFVCDHIKTNTPPSPRTRSDQWYLFAIVQQHNVIVGQIVLTEVWALLRNREIAFLIGASEGWRDQDHHHLHVLSTIFLEM